jgi:hypothetical protein
LLNEYEFRRNDLVTDGTPAMTRVESGFVGKMNENWVVKFKVFIV